MKVSLKKEKYSSIPEKVLGHYNIATPIETVKKIIQENKSIARFGDGEFDLMYGIGIKYQKYDESLANRLKEVLTTNDKDILVGIPNVFNLEYCKKYTEFAAGFWYDWINRYKFKIVKLLSHNKKYYSAPISRFYLDYIDKSHVEGYIKELKKIWNDRDVVIVEGKESRLGVGNDLFDNMKSIQRIICPSENAYEKYDEILKEILKIDKNKLILFALGPTATVLAYDVHKFGYQAVDIGHVDIEYEWFLRKATKKIKIETKYVMEVQEGRENIKDIKDAKYEKEIITRIML